MSNRSRKFLLQLQGRDQRTEIGVAAALAEPIQCALDLAHAGADRGQRVGNGLLGVIVGVDAEIGAGHVFDDLADDLLDLVGHGAAIGVAQHDPARTGIVSRLRAGQRILRVRFVAVEKMLAVDQRFAALGLGRRNAVADRGEVLLVGGLQRDANVIVPRLRDEADRVGLGIQQAGETGIVRRRAARPACHAERGKRRVRQFRTLGKEFRVGRIGAGIAALDVIDAELVEHAGDDLLVVHGEVDAVHLRAVAQRRIEQIEALAAHVGFLECSSDLVMVVLASHSSPRGMELRCCAT